MRAQRISSVVFGIVCVICVADAGAQQRREPPFSGHSGEGRVYNKEAGFSFVPPKGWEEGKASGDAFLVFQGPKADGFGTTLNIRFVKYDESAQLEVIVAAVKAALAKQFKEYQCIDESPVTIDGKKAYCICHQCLIQGKDQIVDTKMLQYLIVGNNNRLYILSFGAAATAFDPLRKTFEQSGLTSRTD
jgi:hypothetical protein